MGSYERMVRELKKLKIYKLDGNSIMDAELYCYGLYIDMLSEQIESLFDSCFIININPVSSDKYIKLYSLPQSLSAIELKDIVLKRMAISNSDFTKDGVIRCIEAGGLKVSIAEALEMGIVKITILEDLGLFITKQEKEDYIKQCLPCHLKAIIIEE